MKNIYVRDVLSRFEQLFTEISNAGWLDYYDRLREFKCYCDSTPALANCLAQLPESDYDFTVHCQDMRDRWPGG